MITILVTGVNIPMELFSSKRWKARIGPSSKLLCLKHCKNLCIIPYMFDYCTDLVVHLFLPKSCNDVPQISEQRHLVR